MPVSVKTITRIIDAAETEAARLASEEVPGAAAQIARVRLRMLDEVAFEHGATPSPDALERLAGTFATGVAARTLTESMARWLPLIGRMVDAMAESRATHEIGWAAHAHFASLDPAALAALSVPEGLAPAERIESPPRDDTDSFHLVSRSPAPVIPAAVMPDGSPNPDLVSLYPSGTWVAVEELEQRIAEDSSNDELVSLLAFMYYCANQLDRAIATYRRAVQLNDRNASAHYYLGNAHFKRGQYEEARHAWQRAVELEPASRMASNARRRAVAVLKMSGDTGPSSRE